MIYVTEATYISDYKIQIKFNNGRNGIIDLQDTILSDHRTIFTELSDKNLFKQFKVQMDTIVWANGLDLAPEYLAQKIQ